MISIAFSEERLADFYRDIENHGPLPRGWELDRNDGYFNAAANKHSEKHPGSDPSLVLLHDKEEDTNWISVSDASQPFIKYLPECTWHRGTMHEVLCRALTLSNATNDRGEPVKELDVTAAFLAVWQTPFSRTIYHPSLRLMPVLSGESIIAEVARFFKRSLLIVTSWDPVTKTSGSVFNPVERPSMVLRHGTGSQNDHVPILVGLLPSRHHPSIDSDPTVDTLFFALEPFEQNNLWHDLHVNA